MAGRHLEDPISIGLQVTMAKTGGRLHDEVATKVKVRPMLKSRMLIMQCSQV